MYNPHNTLLLQIMDDISFRMYEVIYLRYFDNFETSYKYLFSLFIDAYQSVRSICYSLSIVGLTQAGNLLRLLLETESIIHIITTHQELLIKYKDHWKFRDSLIGLDINEKKKKLREHFPDVKDERKLLSYMDYGWFESIAEKGCNESELIHIAGFDDMLEWKKDFLDKLSHISLNPTQFRNNENEFVIISPFMAILSKLFDCLCCDFHAITGYDFKEDGRDLFQGEFRKLYENTKFE